MSARRTGKVSASRPDGLTRPSRTSAIAPPLASPPSHAWTIAGTRSAHGMATGAPLRDDDHNARLNLEHGLDEPVVRRRQSEIRPVIALGLETFGKADEHDRQRRLAGDRYEPPPAGLGRLVVRGSVPGREPDRRRFGGRAATSSSYGTSRPSAARRGRSRRPGSAALRAMSPMMAMDASRGDRQDVRRHS